MDNLKYYNDSFAYDYEIFAPSEKTQKADIIKYPENKTRRKEKKRKSAGLVKKITITALVLGAVCTSLFLRAEISSLKSEINSVNKQITEMESESVRLGVEIERKISLTNLEEAAAELGMQKCEKSQITYIKTNQLDTAENSDGKLTAEVE